MRISDWSSDGCSSDLARFSQYLKAVADADDGDAALCRFHHGPHDRRTCGHCAGAQIIAIGEAAGHADHVNAVGQIGIAMPDHASLTARNFTECPRPIAVARPEERRVGKGFSRQCKSRWSAYPSKKN